MNRTKRLLVGTTLVLFTIMTVFCLSQQATNAQDCRIVRIGSYAPHEGVFVEPATTRISKGSCVIWINWVRAKEVQVIFSDGKKCDDVTDSPMGFDMNSENCYVTNYLPMGTTSSLKFNEAGTYEYEVKVKDGAQEKGKIVVN